MSIHGFREPRGVPWLASAECGGVAVDRIPGAGVVDSVEHSDVVGAHRVQVAAKTAPADQGGQPPYR